MQGEWGELQESFAREAEEQAAPPLPLATHQALATTPVLVLPCALCTMVVGTAPRSWLHRADEDAVPVRLSILKPALPQRKRKKEQAKNSSLLPGSVHSASFPPRLELLLPPHCFPNPTPSRPPAFSPPSPLSNVMYTASASETSSPACLP